MDIFTAIRTRRRVRRFLPEPVCDEHIDILLEAAMMAPSSKNAQPWRFVVISDPKTLQAIAHNDPYASLAADAPLGILICGDESKKNWVEGCSAAAENMLLAAHGLGYGSFWCGIYQDHDRERIMRRRCKLPEGIQPFALMLVGKAAHPLPLLDRYDPHKIHFNTWEDEKEGSEHRPYRF